MRRGGVVLCGGESRRMGRPKAWLPFAGEPMLARVARTLQGVVGPVVVVAARDQEVPPLPAGVRLVRDEQPGRGPLEGLLAGLNALQDQADAVYLTACDAPLLRLAFVERLFDLLGEADICIPWADNHFHPLAAVYRTRIVTVARQLLATGRAGPVSLLERVAVRVVSTEELADVDPSLRSLRNLNTPEDYDAAVRDAAGEAPPATR